METFIAFSTNKRILEESSSGGIFSLIANFIIDNGGVVYGAAINENLEVVHTRIENKKDLFRLKGSKYVQSLLRDSYKNALKDLEDGKYVLYTGTPCQIVSLKKFLKKDYQNLYTQDIVCHGVPVIQAWNYYKKYLQTKYNSKIKEISFRNKTKGWENFSVKIVFENERIINESFNKNIYMKAFLNNIDLRNSCYKCKYKTKERISDITLADCWGAKKLCPESYNANGTSLVIIQSNKGRELFNQIKDKIVFKEFDLNKAIDFNSALIKSVEYNKNKSNFLEELKYNDFDKTVKKYIPNNTLKTYIKRISQKTNMILKKLKIKK